MQAFKVTYKYLRVYTQGNLKFRKDGNTLLTIVGSRVNLYELINQTAIERLKSFDVKRKYQLDKIAQRSDLC